MTVSVDKGTFKLVSSVPHDKAGTSVLRMQYAASGRPLPLPLLQDHDMVGLELRNTQAEQAGRCVTETS